MSRASAKLVNSGMRLLRAFSSASSSSSSSSSSSTPSAAKALLLAAGVEHIAGSPDDVTVNGGGAQLGEAGWGERLWGREKRQTARDEGDGGDERGGGG